jgi:hypothetical protein
LSRDCWDLKQNQGSQKYKILVLSDFGKTAQVEPRNLSAQHYPRLCIQLLEKGKLLSGSRSGVDWSKGDLMGQASDCKIPCWTSRCWIDHSSLYSSLWAPSQDPASCCRSCCLSNYLTRLRLRSGNMAFRVGTCRSFLLELEQPTS